MQISTLQKLIIQTVNTKRHSNFAEMAVFVFCKVIEKKYEVLGFMEYSVIIDLIGR